MNGIKMSAEIHVQQSSQELGDAVELDDKNASVESSNASALGEVRIHSSGTTTPLDHDNCSSEANDVMTNDTQTSMMYINNALDTRNSSDVHLCDVIQNPNIVSDHVMPSTVTSSLTSEELLNLRSLSLSVDSLKVSNSELQQTVDVLAARLRALEKSYEESECLNRTLERNVELLQKENDRLSSRVRLIASDHSAAPTTPAPKAEDSDIAVKPVDVMAQLSNDLELTKTEVQKLCNDLLSLTAVTKDISAKAIWLESEFQKFLRRHALIVENLCPKEDKSASTMFSVFVNSVLGVKIEDGDIDSVHVINLQGAAGASPEKRPRPILVTFSCYGIRSRIFKAWLGYRSSQMLGVGALSGERGSGICIKEYLTDLQESIYNEALQIRNRHQIADCWTFKGKTYVRTLEGEVKEFNKDQWTSKHDSTSGGCSIM